MSRHALLFINGAILTVCAVFIYDARAFVLTGLMLFLPFLDKHWLNQQRLNLSDSFIHSRSVFLFSTATTVISLILIGLHPQFAVTALGILLFTALPEEWFFRFYFMPGMEAFISKYHPHSSRWNMWLANIMTSLLFALNHVPLQGLSGLLVIFPSLWLGWLYQKYKNLIFVILMHVLLNIVFLIYIKKLAMMHKLM
jgi:membrane protease YdiL (CAAX protease family)